MIKTPNWVYTTYVFRSKEKELILDFQNKLSTWTKEETLSKDAWNGSPYWLGNILLHVGFGHDNKLSNFTECRYRGAIDEIGEVEEGYLRGERFFYFRVVTETAWIEMPKMWDLIIQKLYTEKIEFGFIAQEECYEFVDRYRPDILELIGISIDEKYWADSYIDDYNYENYKWLGDFTGEMTASAVAETFSSILGSKIEKDAIEDLDQREALVYRVNEVLSAVDEDAYINIIKIEDVSPADFN